MSTVDLSCSNLELKKLTRMDKPQFLQFYVEKKTAVVQASPPPHTHTDSNFIAGRPKAVLLFWFFGDFRCGVWLFFVILAGYIFNKKCYSM